MASRLLWRKDGSEGEKLNDVAKKCKDTIESFIIQLHFVEYK